MAEENESKNIRHLHKNRKRMAGVLVAVIVICISACVLISPAMSATGKTYCGYKEHFHTAACYEEIDGRTELICEKPEHTHISDCYQR